MFFVPGDISTGLSNSFSRNKMFPMRSLGSPWMRSAPASLKMIDTMLLVLLCVLLYLYLHMCRVYSYFERQGVPYLKPMPFFGNSSPFVFQQMPYAELSRKFYNEFRHCRFGGAFELMQPAVVVSDPELLRQICVRDFQHFTDRFMVETPCDTTFSRALSNLQGIRWRHMRLSLSPCFTASKTKMLFSLLNQCSRQLTDHLTAEYSEKQVDGVVAVEARNLSMRQSADLIATIAYGATVNSHKDRDNMFYQSGSKMIQLDWRLCLLAVLHMNCPSAMRTLGISVMPSHLLRFLNGTVTATVERRVKQGITRSDMIQLLLQAKSGQLSSAAGKPEWDEADLMAQCFIFFVAGYEAPSTSLSFLLILLATHPRVQERLLEEIDQVVPRLEDITYETVQSMTYLDQVIKESLRLYPPAVMVNRVCTKQYIIAATDCSPELRIDPGIVVLLAIYAMHRDPRFYRDPYSFDPDRFGEGRKHEIPANAYMPFGVGPRKCLGARLGIMTLKVVAIHILQKFKLASNNRTPFPFKLSAKTFSMSVEGGSWFNLSPRHSQ